MRTQEELEIIKLQSLVNLYLHLKREDRAVFEDRFNVWNAKLIRLKTAQ